MNENYDGIDKFITITIDIKDYEENEVSILFENDISHILPKDYLSEN